jgi:multiple sugar transport system ATP-binding protein
VAIGRAIVRKPEVFLFDEPLSNLDASLRVQMRVELSRLHKELKTTMIYVTHDQVEAMTLGERIVVINGGRIEQVGTPFDLYNNPGNLFVAGFLGAPKMNFIPAAVAHIGTIGVRVRLADGTLVDADADGFDALVDDKVTLGIRAEHMTVLPAATQQANVLAAVVGHVEYLGDQTIVYASMPGDAALIALRQPQGGAMLRAGERIAVHLPPAHCHLFDANGRAFSRA